MSEQGKRISVPKKLDKWIGGMVGYEHMSTPEEREYNKIWHRNYRKNNRDRVNETNRKSWHKTKKYRRRAKTIGDRICMFCEIKLSSETVGMKRTKYCQNCKENPKVKAYLRNLYIRRWRQKKLGLPQEPVIKKAVVYVPGKGRKPFKSIIPEA